MKLTVVITKPGQWRLLRDISFKYEMKLEREGWTVVESWMHAPGLAGILAVG